MWVGILFKENPLLSQPGADPDFHRHFPPWPVKNKKGNLLGLPFLFSVVQIIYSYAKVSFTVNRDAFLAGSALAMAEMSRIPISQLSDPLRPKM